MAISYRQRFNKLYKLHVQALRLQGVADSGRDVYSRAMHPLCDFHSVCFGQLSMQQIQDYFPVLFEAHSWSTAKADRIPNSAWHLSTPAARAQTRLGLGLHCACLLYTSDAADE